MLVLALSVTGARAAGTVRAWGNNNDGQCNVPAGLNDVVAVAGGGLQSLALRANGTVVAWGWNLQGETNVPSGLANVTAVAASYGYSLALKSDGTVVGWGTASNTIPAGLTNVIAISAGVDHKLALLRNGTVVSWGNAYAPPATLSNAIAVAAGNGHSLALKTDGKVVAWGSNASGKTNVPPGLANVVAIAAGDDHCLALKSDGTITAWGSNTNGQTTVPSGLTGVIGISAGSAHSLALKNDGTVVAWGRSDFGQTSPPPFLAGVVGISGGTYHNLALVGDGVPVITVPPRSQTVALGKDTAFRVFVAGSTPLSYQWSRNGTNLSGATAATLALPDVQLADAGDYRVAITNSFGWTVSSTATLTPVATPPSILVQPQDASVNCGSGTSFGITVDGSKPFSYQWQFGDAIIPDATNATLALTTVTTNAAGQYSVVVTNPFGSITSRLAALTVAIQPLEITSPLSASGRQGVSFRYTVTAPNAVLFGASVLPAGLTIEPLTGLISGFPQETGTFYVTLSAANTCTQTQQTLTLTIGSGIPVITSSTAINCTEGAAITPYQITATGSPTSFDAVNLPTGLSVDRAAGVISGTPVLAGTFTSTLYASNAWGIGSASLTFTIANAIISGMRLDDVTFRYHSPYLLDFEFTLRDQDGNGIVTKPSLLSAVCMENTHPGTTLVIWPDEEPDLPTATELVTNVVSETGIFITRNAGLLASKVVKTYLVLDYTESVSDPVLNGDSNGDSISDAVDFMVSGAQYFVEHMPAEAQVGVYEFHREDQDPNQVMALTRDKGLLNEAIAGIWTNYVDWFYAGSRCWDAVDAAILELGPENPDEQRHVIFISDGLDSSSIATPDLVISDANAGKVRVHCIAFGNNADTNTLAQITSATGGRLFFAENQADLLQEFALISKDVQAQYTLRWASTRRSTNEIAPFFLLSYQGHTATPAEWNWSFLTNVTESYITNEDITIDTNTEPPTMTTNTTIETNILSEISVVWENAQLDHYIATSNAGTVTEGTLRLAKDEEVKPTGISLRATYIPRYIRQLRLHYRANWPCTVSLNATNTGEMFYGWSLSESNDVDGSQWLLLSSPNPQSTVGSLPFPGFGPVLTFAFKDVLSNPSNAFALFDVDNSIYTGIPAGGQKFVFEPGSTNAFITDYPALPYGTPVPWLISYGFTNNLVAAEVADSDSDGVLNWQEYRANTDPLDPNSKLVVHSVTHDVYGRYQITFSSALNRFYRVEASTDLVNWVTVEDNIVGTGADLTIQDLRFDPDIPQDFYRVLVY